MRKLILLAPVAAVAAIAVFIGRDTGSDDETFADVPPERYQVRLSSFETTVDSQGTIAPAETAELTFSRAGRVSEVLVELGDSVDAGQPLASLDPGDLRLEVASAEAGELAAQSALRASQAELAASTGAQGNVALEKVAQDEAKLAMAAAQAEKARLYLELATLTAPFAGTVTAIMAQPGASIDAGEAAVAIADLSKFHIELLIDQKNISKVGADKSAHVMVQALPFRFLEGRVRSVAPLPMDKSGEVLYPVLVELESSNAPVRVGMTADVKIVMSQKIPTITIPIRAVRSGAGRNTVEIIARNSLPKEARGATVFAGFDMYGGFDGFGQGDDDTDDFGERSSVFGGFSGFGEDESARNIDIDAEPTNRSENQGTEAATRGAPAAGTADTPGAAFWPWGGSWGGSSEKQSGGPWGEGTWGKSWGKSWGEGGGFDALPTLEVLGADLDGLPTRFVEVTLGRTSGTDVTVLEGLWHGDIVIMPRDQGDAAGQ